MQPTMPPLASIEIPVLTRPRFGLERPAGQGKTPIGRSYKPRMYYDEPLPTKPSENAPKNAQIVGRILDNSGVTYQLKIGDVEINDVGVDEILDYVSALDLEQYENREFEEEREVLKAYEAERERVRHEQLERMKERAKRKGVVPYEDDTGTNDETEGGEENFGRHGRARPTYTHLFKKNKGRGRPRKDTATGSSRPLSDEEGTEESSEDMSPAQASIMRPIAPLAELPKRRRRKRDKATGELLPLSPVAQASTLAKKQQRRRRHPLTGELMPVGWRYNPIGRDDTYEKRQAGRSSPSFRKLSISQEHNAKRQKLETGSDNSRSPSPLPTKAELFAQFSPHNAQTMKRNGELKQNKNSITKSHYSEDDSDVVEVVKGSNFKLQPKPARSRLSNNVMLQSMISSSAANSSPEPEIRTSMLHPKAPKANVASASARKPPTANPGRSREARTSILNPSAGRASSTDPLVRFSERDEDNGSSLEDEEWFIEGILAHHWSDPRTHPLEFGEQPVMLYQVKWEGYKEPTW